MAGDPIILFFDCQGRQIRWKSPQVVIRTHRVAATRHGRILIGHIGFEPQTGRTNGISDRQQRFFASQRATQALARLHLLLRLWFLMSLLPRERELCLVALRGRIVEVGLKFNVRFRKRTATAAFVTLLLGERPCVRAAPKTLKSARSTPSANSDWRRESYLE